MYLLRVSPLFFFVFLVVEGATILRLDDGGVLNEDRRGGLLGLGREVVGTGRGVLGGVVGGVLGGASGTLRGVAIGAEHGYSGNSYLGGGDVIGAPGGLVAGQSSNHLSAASEGGSLSAVGGSSHLDAEQASLLSSSKNSASSSNKSSKRKSSSSFGGSSSNLNQEGFGASQSNKLIYGENDGLNLEANSGRYGHDGINTYGQRNIGVNAAGQSNIEASKLNASQSQFSGSSDTEVEESESNSQSNSESQEAREVSRINAGSQYGAVDQNYGRRNVGIDSSDAIAKSYF